MLEGLLDFDSKAFVFLNGLGSEEFDGIWMLVTKQISWLPMFILVFYLTYKKIGLKNFLIAISLLAILILYTDQMTNVFKNSIQRLRPCNTPNIKDSIRIIIHRDSFSFFSGHASNSMASTVFIYLIIRKYFKHTYLLFLFPLFFAYSRIYLGLHFPLDIISGFLFGIINGSIFYLLYKKVLTISYNKTFN
jgi:undecaprenyl-diphosphatase